MKKILLALAVIGFSTAAYSTENFIVDPTHSYVEYHISHFGYSKQQGKWMASGTIAVDKEKIQNSSVNIDIQVANIITGVPKLDEHLQSATFFDVTKFPNATFTSQKVSPIKNGKFTVEGMLTLHGVSKPVTLHVTKNSFAVNQMTKQNAVGFSATADIKRSDYGVSAYIPGLSDTVKLDIEVEAQQGSPAK